MAFNLAAKFLNLVYGLSSYSVPHNMIDSLSTYVDYIARLELENHFSTPMFWIGMYIALASAVCILAMVADLLHGFHSRKLWFPCTYFRINAAFLTIIAVAMKLPVDLTGSMMGQVDRTTKLGSMAFMCTIMANLLPCIATMGSNELLSNITALCVLVITVVVNVCIQIQTGVVSTYIYEECNSVKKVCTGDNNVNKITSVPLISSLINNTASVYVVLLLVLLILHVSSCIAILKSKNIIESKYQQRHERASKHIQTSPGEVLPPVEKLEEYVISHWIMAGSGSPQLIITACFHTTSASGVICLLVAILHTYTMFSTSQAILQKNYDSDYGSSMMIILIVQFIGVMIGTIAPLSRCFATLSFKVSPEIITNHFKVFKVKHYWTQKLYDWKHASIRLPFRSHSLEVVIETLKRLILNICIGLQNGVVVVCKVIALIPFLFMLFFLYCIRYMKWLLCNKYYEVEDEHNDHSRYVLHLEDEMELGERYLKRLSKSANRLIKKGAKTQLNNLKNLILEKSTSCFEGVKKFDNIDDPCVDCWSLPVVTLTTLILSLPKIGKEEVDSLLESVREGLKYVMVVEKSLNAKKDYLGFQMAAADLWQEIRFDKKWLGNQLQNPSFQAYTAEQIVDWFRDKANNIISSEDRSKDDTGVENDDLRHKSICTNSMYRITETILRSNDVTVSPEELFDSLSKMIADIIAACLTNLPQAIIMKCHTNVIEEREASVYDAAKLLGETTQIIETLRGRNIPNMDPCDLPFIEKWRAYLGSP